MSQVNYNIDARRVCTITLNRDEKRNALSNEVACQLMQRLGQAEQDGVRVVLLRANPRVKVWCAGHDLSELDLQDLHVENLTLKLANMIREMPIPVIAMVEGSVYAGGFILLLSADMVIAAENADVAITSNKLGIPLPLDLYAHWLRVMGMHKTKELLFTAGTISAHDAYHAGLYNHVVARDRLEPFTQELVTKILECSASAIANTKRQLNLIAQQSGVSEAERREIKSSNEAIIESDETRGRLANLLASLKRS